MDDIGDFFNQIGAFITESVVLVTGVGALVDNAVNEYPEEEQSCQTIWGESSDVNCRLEDNGEAIENMKEDNIVRKDNDNIGRGFFDFISGGSSSGGDDDSDAGYDYKSGSTVDESSDGWSIFGYSGVDADYSVDTSSDSYSSSDSGSDYESGSDSDSGDRDSWW